MYNQDIRQTATESNVKLWRIADALGITDSKLFPQTPSIRAVPRGEGEIFSIIEKLAQEVS